MKNREKYAKEILDIACLGKSIAMDLNGNLVSCGDIDCYECEFHENYYDNDDCYVSIKKWCESDYVEKPKISESDKRFLDYLPDNYKWLIRNENGLLYAYNCKPQKDYVSMWFGEGAVLKISKQYKVTFPMVKWEDKEPWLIEDLKKLEVKDNG